MPVLTVKHGSHKIAQSGAVARYIARAAGLMPADPMDEARVNMIYEQFRDIRTRFGKMKYAGTSKWGDNMKFLPDVPAQTKAFKELEETVVPAMLMKIENLYPKAGLFLD